VERLTATIVLALGTLVLVGTLVSVALDRWEPTVGRLFVLLLVGAGMWRAASHLRRPVLRG